MIRRTVALLLSVTACAGPQRAHPTTTPPTPTSPATTPAGDVPADLLNPAVTQATIRDTICTAGWTATIRPPTSITGPIKVRQIKTYGYSDTNPARYEADHAVNLGAGGNPTNAANLWPEPRTFFPSDDVVEVQTQRDICAGKIALAAGQQKVYELKLSHGYSRARSLG